MLSGRGLAQAIRQWGLVTGTGASGLALGFAADIEKSVGGSLTREMRGGRAGNHLLRGSRRMRKACELR